MVYLIHTELRYTVNHTSVLQSGLRYGHFTPEQRASSWKLAGMEPRSHCPYPFTIDLQRTRLSWNTAEACTVDSGRETSVCHVQGEMAWIRAVYSGMEQKHVTVDSGTEGKSNVFELTHQLFYLNLIYWYDMSRYWNIKERLLVSSCVSFRPCVRMEQPKLPLDRFSWNLTFEYFSRICR